LLARWIQTGELGRQQCWLLVSVSAWSEGVDDRPAPCDRASITSCLQAQNCSISRISFPSDISYQTRPNTPTQAYFLYCFEPGGNRVELFGDTGYLIFDPDWKALVWDVANEVDLEKSSIWFGSQLAKTFYRYATPVVPGHSLEEIGR
jgi:hypothetical protein